MTRRRHLRFATACALALAGAALTGCSPSPAPTPSPTPAFASEEEAFAAAEETYRAYIDAFNAENSGAIPPKPSLDFLSGDVLADEVAARKDQSKAGIHIEGVSKILTFDGTSSDLSSPILSVHATVCLDASDSRAIDMNGADVTADGRSDVYAVSVGFRGESRSLQLASYELDFSVQC